MVATSKFVVTVGSPYGLTLRMKKLGSCSITCTNVDSKKRNNWVSASLGPIFKGNLKVKICPALDAAKSPRISFTPKTIC